MQTTEIQTTNIGGIETACVDRKGLAQLIGQQCLQPPPQSSLVIFDCNGHAISIVNNDPKAMELLHTADLIHADGQSIILFSKWTSGPVIPERTATTDMIHDIPEYFDKVLKHFLLGGKEDIVSKAANIYQKKHPNVEIAGYHHGYFEETFEDELCEIINQSNTDILWVGLGKPKEQEFCVRNKDKLNVSVIITCGGCYNYITGDYARAPLWMQNIGLEWLHRMATMPKQLFFRYLTTNPHAIYCVLINEFRSPKNKDT